jgi:hypothetical protein
MLNINRAHALMFLNQAGEARAIYFAYYDKLMTGAEWARVAIQKDFDELRKAGFDNPLMKEIEAAIRMRPGANVLTPVSRR